MEGAATIGKVVDVWPTMASARPIHLYGLNCAEPEEMPSPPTIGKEP